MPLESTGEGARIDVTRMTDIVQRFTTAAPTALTEADQEELRHLRDERARYQQRYNYMTTGAGFIGMGATDYPGARPLTPEQQAANLRAWQERDAQAKQAAVTRREAEARALALLEERLGSDAVAKLQNGGGYTVPSQQWPGVVYLVPREPHERIKVIREGAVVTESCLVTTDASLPWADVLLQRVTAIRADESVVYATGVLHHREHPGGVAFAPVLADPPARRRWFGR